MISQTLKLKSMLRQHVICSGMCISVLWAYCNTPSSTTGEKPSLLLFGFNCHHPTEAETLPTKLPNHTDYREELVVSPSLARAWRREAFAQSTTSAKGWICQACHS